MKYRKKPVVIEAIQYTGDNIHIVMDFVKKLSGKDNSESMIYNAIVGNEYFIITLEGNMKISKNDYVIKGVQREFYPCKPDIFELTYEKADSETVKAVQSTLDAVNHINKQQCLSKPLCNY